MEGNERKRKEEDMDYGFHYEFAVLPRYIYWKKKINVGLITFKSLFSIKQPVFLLVRTGRSISMESKCVNTNCQITASIIESYTLVLTLNQDFARMEAMLTH